jgi:hypothetical protein
MGQTHIFTIQEDGIRNADHQPDYSRATELGISVIKLCLDPDFMDLPEGLLRRPTASLGNSSDCARHVAVLHSSDEEQLFWTGNCLQRLDHLTDVNLSEFKKSFLEACAKRGL